MNSSITTTTSSRKSFPPAASTNSHRNVPSIMTKASPVDVLSSHHQQQQHSPSKLAKPRPPAKRSSKAAQESQTADESSPLPLMQKKRSNRPARKALSTGSLGDVKTSKPLSQESVVILKRGDDLSLLLPDPFNITRGDNASSDGGERNHRFTNKDRPHSRDSSPSRRRNSQPTPKSRRSQRRKDVKALTEALHNVEADMLLGTSPPQPTGSTSSGESSEDVVSTGNQKVVTVPKSDAKRRRRRERVSSSPARTNTAALFPPLPATTVVEDAVVEEAKSSSLKVTFAKSTIVQARRGSSPAVEIKHYIAPLVATAPSSLPSAPLNDPFGKSAPRTPMASSITYPPQSKASPLYAGPTFSNSPAPNALPLPSFNSRGSTESSPPSSAFSRPNFPTTPTPQRLRTTSASSFLNRSPGFDQDEDIFGMDGLTDSIAPMNQQDLRAKSRDLLGLLSSSVAAQQKPVPQPVNNNVIPQPILQDYHLPLKMMTSHPPQNGITREMTMGIRSMLKIE